MTVMDTSRQTVDNLLRGRKAERVALMDSPWEDALADWVKQGYPLRKDYKEVGEDRWRREDGRWIEAEVAGEYEEPVPPWEHFGYDMVGIGPWFDVMPLRDYEEVVEETDAWEAKRNGAGAVLKYWKHKSGTPEHIDFRMTTREVWERDYRGALAGIRSAARRYQGHAQEYRSCCRRAEVGSLRAHVYLGAHAPEHGRRDAVRKPAAGPGLGARLQPGLYGFLQAVLSPI